MYDQTIQDVLINPRTPIFSYFIYNICTSTIRSRQPRYYTMALFTPQSLYADSLYAGCISTFLFGFYTPIAARCSLVLWNRYKARNQLDWYLVLTHIAYVILVTARSITVLIHVIQPVIRGVLEPPSPWSRSSVFVNALWMVSTIISDLFISYRAYIVWGKNIYVLVVPAALVLGNFGKSSRPVLITLNFFLIQPYVAVMLLSLFQMKSAPNPMTEDNTMAYFADLALGVKRFVIVTLVTNLICTGLISFRIWNVRRKVSVVNQRVGSNDSLSGLLSLLIESAAIYTVILIIHIVAISLENFTLISIFTDIQTPIIGIVFSSIIVSVAQGSAFGNTSANFQASGERRTVAWPAGSRSNTATNTGRIPTTEISMQTVITTHRDNDVEVEGEAEEYAKDFIDLGKPVAYDRDPNMMVHFQS
ncbi:hypothetical protein D9757_005132 [Collybiopsis confluens]|uniref:Uncharacterized protein n=1 Tax=Collybiopsis confluens TaxID=2823264 RepID=A0A8H5MCS6_9AGAR|nr:hypothetical protein D9757_005132 [Collybiopsis confluens]